MTVETLTYVALAERLKISPEAARSFSKRLRLPRIRSNDGKTLVTVDLDEVRHKPMPARSSGGDLAITGVVATLKTRIEALQRSLPSSKQPLPIIGRTSSVNVTGRSFWSLSCWRPLQT